MDFLSGHMPPWRHSVESSQLAFESITNFLIHTFQSKGSDFRKVASARALTMIYFTCACLQCTTRSDSHATLHALPRACGHGPLPGAQAHAQAAAGAATELFPSDLQFSGSKSKLSLPGEAIRAQQPGEHHSNSMNIRPT